MSNGNIQTTTQEVQTEITTTGNLENLWKEVGAEYEVGTYPEFQEYLSDDKNRASFYTDVIEPQYDIEY